MSESATSKDYKRELTHIVFTLVLTVVALVISSWLAWKPLEKATTNADAAGLLLGFYGLVGTAVGFYIAIRQIRNAELASEAATLASQQARSRFLSYDVVSELARAASALRETQRHVNNDSWLIVMDSMSEARISIVRLAEIPSAIDEGGREQLKSISGKIEKFGKKIRSSLSKGTLLPDKAGFLHSLSEYEIEMNKISLKVEMKL